MRIGVLALQGAFKEHIEVLKDLHIESVEVREPKDLVGINGLILPGGESTSMGKLLNQTPLMDCIKEQIYSGLPVWGTCAGMILLAKDIQSDAGHLRCMNITVERNSFGRQLSSFSTALVLPFMDDVAFPMVFIRAPIVVDHEDSVEVLVKVKNHIVAARENHMLVTSFHPELTNDHRFHAYFIEEFCR